MVELDPVSSDHLGCMRRGRVSICAVEPASISTARWSYFGVNPDNIPEYSKYVQGLIRYTHIKKDLNNLTFHLKTLEKEQN